MSDRENATTPAQPVAFREVAAGTGPSEPQQVSHIRTHHAASMKTMSGGAPALVIAHSRTRTWADRLGIGLSGLCLVHCLLTPLVIILIPAIEVSVYHEMFHRSLLMVLPLIALGAFIPGYRRHRHKSVFVWSIPGLALIALGALAFENNIWMQTVTSVAGSALLIRAHFINHGLCAKCESHHHHHHV